VARGTALSLAARVGVLAVIVGCSAAATRPAPPSAPAIDAGQADQMLALLRASARRPVAADIDAQGIADARTLCRCSRCPAARVGQEPAARRCLMAASGTALIVAQHNLSRRVTAEQYRTLLAGLPGGAAATRLPDGARPRRSLAALATRLARLGAAPAVT
jgi:hypothetical protein